MGTKQYKELVKTKVLAAAFKYLSNIQQTHSKVKYIQYQNLEIQPYLSSPLFSRKEISTLFRLCSRTISGIRSDFSELYKPDLACPVCRQHPDTLPGLMTCPALAHIVQKENDSSQIAFSGIFSCDVSKQKAVTQLYVYGGQGQPADEGGDGRHRPHPPPLGLAQLHFYRRDLTSALGIFQCAIGYY